MASLSITLCKLGDPVSSQQRAPTRRAPTFMENTHA
ncbi:hypothetical protein FHR61_000421 [Xanthomonas arboricola]|uniref:Uncharacterized protein n=1 Tax=Xanthomonas cannabis TaxID=1885674 RepID=A0ABR6JK94_9XANT|nr:hypothetical protein [Xanthomonas cannabis]MBB5520625.1 hypothetical protein [Xanthomonas cannabis]